MYNLVTVTTRFPDQTDSPQSYSFIYANPNLEELEAHLKNEYAKINKDIIVDVESKLFVVTSSKYDFAASTVVYIDYDEETGEYKFTPKQTVALSNSREHVGYQTIRISDDSEIKVLSLVFREVLEDSDKAISFAKNNWEYSILQDEVFDDLYAWCIYCSVYDKATESIKVTYPVRYTDKLVSEVDTAGVYKTSETETEIKYLTHVKSPRRATEKVQAKLEADKKVDAIMKSSDCELATISISNTASKITTMPSYVSTIQND